MHRFAGKQSKEINFYKSASLLLVISLTRCGQTRQQLPVFLGRFEVNIFKDYLV